MAERLRSTTRARLSMCWSARPVLMDEFGLPIHNNPFLKRAHPGERVIPAADNRFRFKDVCERWDGHGFPPISG